MCGEAGEVANEAKKIRRIEMDMVTPDMLGSMAGRPATAQRQLREIAIRTKLAKEIGDTYLYLDLLATKAGLRVEDCVRMAFNDKSAELGFPHRIP